jgi:hypothetical protein
MWWWAQALRSPLIPTSMRMRLLRVGAFTAIREMKRLALRREE